MALNGKGFYIWQIPHCESGNATQIAARAEAAGLSHVLIKIADAGNAFNIDRNGRDLVPPVVAALHARGIQAWGWHYVYGYDPAAEARVAVQRTLPLNLDGYVIDAEAEFQYSGRAAVARTFCQQLRAGLGSMPIALSSYRFPQYHTAFPWSVFLEYCDYNFPQVYWEGSHNGAEQLQRCVEEFRKISPFRPIIPTGPAYSNGGWRPAASELTAFMQKALELGLTGANFWSWDYSTQSSYLDLWNAVANFPWPPAPAADIAQQLPGLWNTHDPNRVISLYQDNAAHVTGARTVVGIQAILDWYAQLFTERLPGALFQLNGFSGTGNSRHISWTATSQAGSVHDGNDTIGIRDGKIQYHYTYFTVQSAG
ncbi:MAG: nuclear transport factor 2 family protein [Anaerolineales bacterium]|nr:nuclear transport factor 2 family protein [Anaerolineales bacterium]